MNWPLAVGVAACLCAAGIIALATLYWLAYKWSDFCYAMWGAKGAVPFVVSFVTFMCCVIMAFTYALRHSDIAWAWHP